MRQNSIAKGLLIAAVTMLAVPVFAAEAQDAAAGDWLLKSDFDGRPMNSLLLISKDAGGAYSGKWASFFGISNVDNLKVEGETISFSQTNRFRDQEMTSTFKGTIKNGTLEGMMSNDNGDISFKGTRLDAPSILGVWEFRRERDGQEVVSKLTVSRDKDGNFAADWQSGGQEGRTWEISDVKYADGKLSFTRKSTNAERPMEMKYVLTAQNDTITGTSTSQRGEREVEGKRVANELVGKWELTLTSDRGERKQLLYILPDMTAMYGSVDVGKIDYQDGKVGFKYQMSFGERSFENEFKGQLENGKLTGEMAGSRGTQQVTGQKMAS